MSVPRGVVDYALQRRASVADVAAGRVAHADACDAGFYLLQAAEHHGRPTTTPCPLCRHELVWVSWVFGERLGAAAGSARSPEEIDRLAGAVGEFTVHVVEVCRSCRWNHLVQSHVLGTGTSGGSSGPGRRRRTAST